MRVGTWQRGPVTVLTLASFLGSLSPARLVHAQDGAATRSTEVREKSAPAREDSAVVRADLPRDTGSVALSSDAPGAPQGDEAVKEEGVVERASSASTAVLSSLETGLAGAAPVHVDSLAVGGDKTGVSSQAISLPQGSGKIQGMGESFSTQLSTGVATFSVPISLPKARGSAQPSLSLSYSSASGHGLGGVGFDIGVPYIAGRRTAAFPRTTTKASWQPQQDRFVFNGGQELCPSAP